jgi:hypothetical protein
MIEVIVVERQLRVFICNVWCGIPARVVYADRWVMDFRRRPGSDQPDAQMLEDGPDHYRVFDAADDPHGALALWADQRVHFIPGQGSSCLIYRPWLYR